MSAKSIARRPQGRPSDYSDQLADLTCERMIMGRSIRRISEMDDIACEDKIYILSLANR